jgi:hypothetical protein
MAIKIYRLDRPYLDLGDLCYFIQSSAFFRKLRMIMIQMEDFKDATERSGSNAHLLFWPELP